jgi:hypothetical protein
MVELNLWLDSYDDIYSDFDSRHYLKRRISEDFLHELRTEMKYKEEHADAMILLLPDERRAEEAEKIIAESLTDFLAGQFRFHSNKCRMKMNRGILILSAGFVIMLVNLSVGFFSGASFAAHAVRVLLEPGGWFLLWAGLDFLFYDFAELKKERDFYKKLCGMHIRFKSS